MIDIKSIRELCDKATPGPWDTSNDGTVGGEHAVCHAWKSCDADFIAKSREIIPALLDELEAAQNTQRWIPVTERLPEQYEPVLIYSPLWDFSVIAIMRDDNEFMSGEHAVTPTHWMPLPETPKGESHE